MWIFHILEEPIFSSYQEVGDAVPVPIDDGWAGRVASKDTVIDRTYFFKYVIVVGAGYITVKENVATVEEEVELAVAVPVGEAEFSSAAATGLSCLEA